MSLSAVLSAQSVEILSKHFGGRRLYVPAGPSAGAARLRSLIGEAELTRLREAYACGSVSVPTLRGRGHRGPSRGDRAARNAEIVRLSKEKTRADLAARFGLTEASIYGILSSAS